MANGSIPGYQNRVNTQRTDPAKKPVDKWLLVISFLVPLVGFIYFFVKRKSSPTAAKAAGKWALVGAILQIVIVLALLILYFLLGVILMIITGYAISGLGDMNFC